MQLNENSRILTKQLAPNVKRSEGIYFTPQNIIADMIERIKILVKTKRMRIKTILEPSCGSCNFIKQLDKKMRNKEIHGVECNTCIFKHMKTLRLSQNMFKMVNQDFLKMKSRKFDMIIGNPPYARARMSEYSEYHKGTGNLYIYFLLKGLSLLKLNGILCFLIPASFLKTLNYNKVREHIYTNYNILDIVHYDGEHFLNTDINTISICIQNKKPINNDMFTTKWETSKETLLSFNTKHKTNLINKLTKNTVSMHDLGYEMRFGKSQEVKGPLLLIKMCNYFNHKTPCKIDFVSHLKTTSKHVPENYIYVRHNIVFLRFLISSLQNNKTKRFVELYFNKHTFTLNELRHVLPLYITGRRDVLNSVKIKKKFGVRNFKGRVKYLKHAVQPYVYKVNYNDGDQETMDVQEVLQHMNINTSVRGF
jgi:hypothetical protein